MPTTTPSESAEQAALDAVKASGESLSLNNTERQMLVTSGIVFGLVAIARAIRDR